MKTEPMKPSLETCCELIRAATNVAEEVRAIAAAHKHYSLTEIREALRDYDAAMAAKETTK